MKYIFENNKLVETSKTMNVLTLVPIQELEQYKTLIPKAILNELSDEYKQIKLETYENYCFGNIDLFQNTFTNDSHVFFVIDKNNVTLFYNKELLSHEKLITELNLEYSNFHIDTIDIKVIIFMIINIQSDVDIEHIFQLQSIIDDLEDNLIAEKDAEYQVEILKIRKKLLKLKKRYFALNNFLINASSQRIITSEIAQYIKATLDSSTRIYQELNMMVDHTIQIKELYESTLDIKMNNTMNFFTIISTIFLPLTLLVGWYGMNFKYMPELEWEYGYLAIIVIVIIVVLITMRLFKQRGLFK